MKYTTRALQSCSALLLICLFVVLNVVVMTTCSHWYGLLGRSPEVWSTVVVGSEVETERTSQMVVPEWYR
jgi:hypothetical protein